MTLTIKSFDSQKLPLWSTKPVVCHNAPNTDKMNLLPVSLYVLSLFLGVFLGKLMFLLNIDRIQNPPPLRACGFESDLGCH